MDPCQRMFVRVTSVDGEVAVAVDHTFNRLPGSLIKARELSRDGGIIVCPSTNLTRNTFEGQRLAIFDELRFC